MPRRRITTVAVRAPVMLGLGSIGMARDLFFVPSPNLVRMWFCIGLMLGPAVLEAWYRARITTAPAAEPETSSSSPPSP